MIALAAATCLHGAAASSVATAIPSITQTLHTTTNAAGGVIVGFFAGATGSVLVTGRLADLLDPRRLLLTGLGVAALASLVAACAANLPLLVAARVVLGAGTAALYPAAARLLATTNIAHNQPPAHGLAMIVATSELVFGIGPLLGAMVTVLGGWRAGCGMIAPLAAVASLGVWLTTPPDTRLRRSPHRGGHPKALARAQRFARNADLVGALAATTLVLVVLGMLESPVLITSWTGILPVTAAGLVTVLVLRTRMVASPFLDLRSLTRPVVAVNLARVACTYLATYLLVYGVPLWSERRGLSVIAAGVVIAPVAVVSVATVAAAAPIVARRGVRLPILLSAGAVAALGASVVVIAHAADPRPLFAVLAVLGLTSGASNASIQHTTLVTAAAGRIGASAALGRCTQFLSGQLAGVLVGELAPGSAAGMRVLGVVLCGIAVALAATSIPASPTTTRRQC